ncbi:hypothetical protein JCM5350_007580 [Sporobolomyces pararoseus]
MSFSSLPPELVHQIIESTVPHTFHTTTYKDRQDTLCRLSLVSHQFRSIAQPLLLEIVWIRGSQDVEDFILKKGIKKELVSQLVLGMGQFYSEDAERTIQKLSSLKSLTLNCYGSGYAPIDLTFLNSLHQLSSLQLSQDESDVNGPLVLQSLQSLTLNEVYTETMSILLNVRTVPNLRQFALVDNVASSDLLQTLKSRAFRRLLTQLDCLYIDVNVWESPDAEFLHPFASQTLIDCAAYELDEIMNGNNTIIHLRVYNSFSDKKALSSHLEDVCSDLEDYASFLEQNPTIPLQTIYLDTTLRHHVFATPTLDDLARICRERSIELVFEPQYEECTADCYTSAEFWRRQRRRRS